MNHPHERHLALADCLLEPRTLPASFLASTFFEPPAFSVDSPASNVDPIVRAADVDLKEGGSYLQNTYTARYFSFGSNPLGTGLSPLSGVVSGYSQNTALSNLIGAGSSLLGAGPAAVGIAHLGGDMNTVAPAIPRAGMVGVQNSDVRTTANTTSLQNYGGTFSSGYNFGINSSNNYGMGPKVVGSMIAARTGYSDRSPLAPPPGPPGQTPGAGQGAANPGTPGAGAGQGQGSTTPGTPGSSARGGTGQGSGSGPGARQGPDNPGTPNDQPLSGAPIEPTDRPPTP